MPMGFPARFPGYCHDCGGPIEVDDQIGYNLAGEVVHWDLDGCHTAAGLEDIRATEELCPKCFLIHPKGMCDYD